MRPHYVQAWVGALLLFLSWALDSGVIMGAGLALGLLGVLGAVQAIERGEA